MPPAEVNRLEREYESWVGPSKYGRMPEIIYPLLKDLIQQGVFQENLSCQLAERIIEGADYFVPELVRAPIELHASTGRSIKRPVYGVAA